MTRVIEIRYVKKGVITSDYHRFYIEHDISEDGNYRLLKETPGGNRTPIIKPNGTFEDENLARIVLDYIETQKGFEKDVEHLYYN